MYDSQFSEAADAALNAASILHDIGDSIHEAIMLANLGDALKQDRRLSDAVGAFQKAVTIFDRAGDQSRANRAQTKLDSVKGITSSS